VRAIATASNRAFKSCDPVKTEDVVSYWQSTQVARHQQRDRERRALLEMDV